MKTTKREIKTILRELEFKAEEKSWRFLKQAGISFFWARVREELDNSFPDMKLICRCLLFLSMSHEGPTTKHRFSELVREQYFDPKDDRVWQFLEQLEVSSDPHEDKMYPKVSAVLIYLQERVTEISDVLELASRWYVWRAIEDKAIQNQKMEAGGLDQ